MEAFTGEIKAFSFLHAPQGWLLCNGQSYDVRVYVDLQALYAVIGNIYGGSGYYDFKVPDMQGAALVGSGKFPGGDNYVLGQAGGRGALDITLVDSQMPVHTHTFNGLVTGDSAPTRGISVPTADSYVSNVFEVPPPIMKRQGNFYTDGTPDAVLNSQAVGAFPGQLKGHNNMQPYLAINYCICWDGYWPVRP